jgi:hypothetical protein
MTSSQELRAHRVTLAKALVLARDARAILDVRRLELYSGLAERTIDLIVALRPVQLRESRLMEVR